MISMFFPLKLSVLVLLLNILFHGFLFYFMAVFSSVITLNSKYIYSKDCFRFLDVFIPARANLCFYDCFLFVFYKIYSYVLEL